MLKILVLLCLALIAISLGSALVHLLRGQSRSVQTAKALTLRIVLSITLFFALLFAARFGFITPHGLQEGRIPMPTKTPEPKNPPD